MLDPFNLSTPSETFNERHEVIERLGTDGVKQTFLTRDCYSPGHEDRYVVERFSFPVSDEAKLQAIRDLFQEDCERLLTLEEDSRIPKLLTHFEKDSVFYRIREWMEGRPLERTLSASAPLSDEQVVLLLGDLLRTVSQIHERDVLHLNLNPSNILCERETYRLVAINDSSFVQRSARIVVPIPRVSVPPIYEMSDYMPDEQIAGQPAPSSDLYALGMIAIRALDSYPSDETIVDRETGEIRWPGYATLRHPALLSFIEKLVQISPRDRYQSAAQALSELHKLPEELTRLLIVAAIFPREKDVLYAEEQSSSTGESARKGVARKLVPAGVGVLALASAGALIWRAVDPVMVTDNREIDAAVSQTVPEASSKPQIEDSIAPRTESSDSASPDSASPNSASSDSESPESVLPSSEATNSEILSKIVSPDIDYSESVEPEQIEDLAASRPLPAQPSADGRVIEPAEAATLDISTAKSVVSRFYDQVARRSWVGVRSLLNDSLARSLEPPFFYQFSKVTVDDFRIVSQTPDSIDFIVENTYVYLDGTSQREERSYTVEIVDNQPTITATAFEAVIKDRS